MKVLMVNGSSNKTGSTFTALTEVGKELILNGVEYEILQLGSESQRDCIGCRVCRKTGKCTFDENGLNEFVEQARISDGFIFGSPVYYAHPSGRLLSFLDRAFYSGSSAFCSKPGASVVSARRAGTTASIDCINKYFSIASMPIVGSSYWTMVHGNKKEETLQDLEGLQSMRNLAKNMAFLIKSINIAKENGINLPTLEREHVTNFIR